MERRLQPQTSINMTPLIDVILQLIIFFMITTTFKTAPGILLQLPGSTSAQTVQSSVIHIVAVSEKEIYVDRQRTDLAGLSQVLHKRAEVGDPASLKAMVEGDKGASYQFMISILDALRKNGIQGVGLRTLMEKKAAL